MGRYMYDNVLGIDLSADGHSLVTWRQLSDWEECPAWESFTVSFCWVAPSWMLLTVTHHAQGWSVQQQHTRSRAQAAEAQLHAYWL